jgi:hypothetical protein
MASSWVDTARVVMMIEYFGRHDANTRDADDTPIAVATAAARLVVSSPVSS